MKSKRFFVMLLAVILLVVCAIPSVYSWYDHNGELTGNRMGYSRNNLPVSAGTVSVETKKYRTENNKLWYDVKGNKEYGDAVNGSSSVNSGAVQFYGTTFTNTGTAPAYVNLYLSNFRNSPNVKIGTLQPSLTHKGLSSSVHLTNENMVRIYFQFDKANNWNDNGAKRYLVYKTKTGTTEAVQITSHITAAADGTDLKTTQTQILGTNIANTYYVDLPGDATEFYFATDGNNSGFDTTNNTVTQPWYRTNTITNIHAETGYYLTGVADDTTWNAQYNTFNIPGGISVKTYFDTLDINKNQHAYVTLNQGTNYTGSSVTYESDDSNIIEVNSNTGYVTAKEGFVPYDNQGSLVEATSSITTTITGSLGDTIIVTTSVKNRPQIAGATVALNVKVPGATTETVGADTVTTNGTAEIVWYIDNSDGAGAVSFDNVYYTK